MEENIQKEKRKNIFLECLERPRKARTWADLRSECSKWSCNDMNKNQDSTETCASTNATPPAATTLSNLTLEILSLSFLPKQKKQTLKEKNENQLSKSVCLNKAFPQIHTNTWRRVIELIRKFSEHLCKEVEIEDKVGRDLCCINVRMWRALKWLMET